MAAIELLIDGLQLRHDTAANWRTKNPILAAGEAGMETDTFKLKLGDGSTTWNNVPYANNVDLSAYLKSTDAANTYATKEELENAVTGGQVDLSGYLTKTEASNTYLGKSSAAASANKLNTNAGSATQPVYFANGVPVKTTHTLEASVPSDAKFTDTTYSVATTSAAGLMSASDKAKIDGIAESANAYVLPPASKSTLGGVMVGSGITSNSNGAIWLTKANITSVLGYTPPTTDTTYSEATTSSAGLMSATDKAKLDGIAEGANKYTLPMASSTLGGVKTTSTVTSTSGLTACPIISGIPYYKDTNTTYSAMSASEATTGTATTARNITAKVLHDKINAVVDAKAYSLPTATSSVLGGVKVGTNISVSSGTISVANGSTSTKGVVQLTNSAVSTSTTTAATPSAVKAAYDLANSKQSPQTTIAGYGITDTYTKTQVDSALSAKAALASPTFTGTPKAPTAAAGTNTTQLATTAFVTTAISNKTSVSGNANTATALETPRNINGVSFDGTKDISIDVGVKTVNGEEPDANGNVVAVGFDSYWVAGESVEIGDIRLPKGRENSGYVWECVQAGTTGTEQPNFDVSTEIANFVALERIGHMRLIFNLAEKEADEILACGVTYSRTTYPELWQYVQNKSTLLLTEEEWQAKYTETNGTFVPFYSSGNGSTTFRTPLFGGYLKGSASSAEIGAYKEAGLPNITGAMSIPKTDNSETLTDTADFGALYRDGAGSTKTGGTTAATAVQVNFDASLSNAIYGNSDTVTPETMTGIWVIKAIGIVIDTGNTDLTDVLTGIEETAARVSSLEGRADSTDTTINGMTDYVVESWNEGTEWYRIYKSGLIEQGGYAISSPWSFPQAFSDTNYTFVEGNNRGGTSTSGNAHYITEWSTTGFSFSKEGDQNKWWYARGY